MRDICDGLAAQGYVELCPDLFWRQQPGIDITDQTKEEWDQAFKLFGGFNLDLGIEDLKSSLAVLRKLPGVSGKVGTVGYCLGGRRSEEHTSELQSLMRNSYAVFCLKKKKNKAAYTKH